MIERYVLGGALLVGAAGYLLFAVYGLLVVRKFKLLPSRRAGLVLFISGLAGSAALARWTILSRIEWPFQLLFALSSVSMTWAFGALKKTNERVPPR